MKALLLAVIVAVGVGTSSMQVATYQAPAYNYQQNSWDNG